MTHGLPPCLSDVRRGLAIPPSGYESGPQLGSASRCGPVLHAEVTEALMESRRCLRRLR